MLKLLIVSLIFLFFTGSCKKYLSEKEIQNLSIQCTENDSIRDLFILFTGYEYEEIENILIKQIHKGIVIDSFYVSTDRKTFDSVRIQYYTFIHQNIYIRDSFLFEIPHQQTFIVSEIKKALKKHNLMLGHTYDCEFDGCNINGINSQNIHLKKEGFKYP